MPVKGKLVFISQKYIILVFCTETVLLNYVSLQGCTIKNLRNEVKPLLLVQIFVQLSSAL